MGFPAQKAHGSFTGEIVTSFKDRAEGFRVKHWLRGNSVKMYDKAGSIPRVETTIVQTSDFKVLRPLQADPVGRLEWRPLRKDVADQHRRAQLSQRSNDAHLDALAAVDDTTPCARLFDAVCRPVVDHARRVRARRLTDRDDIALLEAISRGKFADHIRFRIATTFSASRVPSPAFPPTDSPLNNGSPSFVVIGRSKLLTSPSTSPSKRMPIPGSWRVPGSPSSSWFFAVSPTPCSPSSAPSPERCDQRLSEPWKTLLQRT